MKNENKNWQTGQAQNWKLLRNNTPCNMSMTKSYKKELLNVIIYLARKIEMINFKSDILEHAQQNDAMIYTGATWDWSMRSHLFRPQPESHPIPRLHAPHYYGELETGNWKTFPAASKIKKIPPYINFQNHTWSGKKKEKILLFRKRHVYGAHQTLI